MRQNTLNMGGDGDEIDMVSVAQDRFEVEFADHELSALYRVGDLYDLIIDKYRARHPKTEMCLSQGAFYRLRAALSEMGAKCPIVPATSVAAVVSDLPDGWNIRRKWWELARRSGLTLPPLELRWTTTDIAFSNRFGGFGPAALAFALVLAAGAIALLTGTPLGWAVLAAFGGFFCSVLVLALLPPWFGDIPRRIETIGDLAREAAGHSFTTLRREKQGCSPANVWLALVALLRDVSGHTAEINRETTFFAPKATFFVRSTTPKG
jgi:hypothetical protein